MNAFEDNPPSLAGEYVSLDDKERCCTRKTQLRFKNLFWFLFGICLSGVCVLFYGTIYGFGHSNAPPQTHPGPILIFSAPISGSSCLIEWEKIFISNKYILLLFQLEFSDNNAQNWEPLQLPNSGFDFNRTIEGLRSSSIYNFRLRGCADVGCGNFTYTQCRTKTPSIPETPGAPMISGLRRNVNAIYFSFNVTSADSGGAAITYVELRYTGMTNKLLTNTSIGCSFRETCASGCNCTVPIPMPYLGSETFSFRTQVANYVGKSGLSIPRQCIIFTDSNRNPICVLTTPPAAPVGLTHKTGVSNVSFQWTTGISVNSLPPAFFEVWLSDPWNNHQEVTKIINVNYNMYQNTTLLPDTVYKFAVRAFDDVLRAGQMSRFLVFQTPVRGACGNHQDVKVLKAQWEYASKNSSKCFVENCKYGEDCTEKCIQRVVGFTKRCSKCWFERTNCLVEACYCILEPKKCQSCYDELCLNSYLNCTGLPSYASPPAELNWTQSKAKY